MVGSTIAYFGMPPGIADDSLIDIIIKGLGVRECQSGEKRALEGPNFVATGGANLLGATSTTIRSTSISISSKLVTLGIDVGGVTLGCEVAFGSMVLYFFTDKALQEDSPWEDPDLFLNALWIESAMGLITRKPRKGVRIINSNKS